MLKVSAAFAITSTLPAVQSSWNNHTCNQSRGCCVPCAQVIPFCIPSIEVDVAKVQVWRIRSMACTGFRHPLRCLLREAQTTQQVPGFLIPSLASPSTRKTFSTSSTKSSRVGMAPISIPADVSVRFFDLPRSKVKSRHPDTPTSAIEVTGPQGDKN